MDSYLTLGSRVCALFCGHWSVDLFTGLQALGCGLWALFTGLWVLDSRFWILGSGLFSPDSGFYLLLQMIHSRDVNLFNGHLAENAQPPSPQRLIDRLCGVFLHCQEFPLAELTHTALFGLFVCLLFVSRSH